MTKLKRRVQSWMAAEAGAAHKLGLTPNHVSAVGIMLAMASGFAYWLSGGDRVLLTVAPLLLLASGFCDALDGVLARLYGEATTFGGFLDSLLDRYADAAIYCGLILGGLCDLTWGLIALVGSILVSYTRARAEAAGVPMETVGLVERAERLLIIVCASFINLFWPEALRWSIIILAVLTHITVLQRVIHFRGRLSSK